MFTSSYSFHPVCKVAYRLSRVAMILNPAVRMWRRVENGLFELVSHVIHGGSNLCEAAGTRSGGPGDGCFESRYIWHQANHLAELYSSEVGDVKDDHNEPNLRKSGVLNARMAHSSSSTVTRWAKPIPKPAKEHPFQKMHRISRGHLRAARPRWHQGARALSGTTTWTIMDVVVGELGGGGRLGFVEGGEVSRSYLLFGRPAPPTTLLAIHPRLVSTCQLSALARVAIEAAGCVCVGNDELHWLADASFQCYTQLPTEH